MTTITAGQVKELREKTGVGILDCRKALEAANGDLDQAAQLLREKGLAKAAKRAEREASEGMIEIYSHGNGRIGVMVEVNCETDFVARSETFREFAHEIALQVAATGPLYITVEDIPGEVIEHETARARTAALEEGKPEQIIERIVEGRLAKFKDESCLMRQSYIRDEEKTIHDLLLDKVAVLGENIVIRRFARWGIGE